MQYEPTLSREELVELATQRYFANVDKKNFDAVMDCFNDTALFTVQTAFTVHAGEEGIGRMFRDFFATYDSIRHHDFVCTVDAKHGRITARFLAELVDTNGQKTQFENTNFWRVRNGKFEEVYVYMNNSNPLV
ncbi:MAG: nuclear transport factor 2 family protein [Cellvibrionales bacterium]|nr:nuclear transport factor 2 family protein [Cellvibrionales bacterium]